jgi:uncharacterized protein YeaO (DUF488 family)
MAIRIVRLGSDRLAGEGPRLGTVRRPPRGVAKADYAAKNYFDVWLPTLAPTPASVKLALAAESEAEWRRFVKKYRREMSGTNETALLHTLAALSHRAHFSVGCYCADEARCHRSILRQLFNELGAKIE